MLNPRDKAKAEIQKRVQQAIKEKELLKIAEEKPSSVIYEILKRADPTFVTPHYDIDALINISKNYINGRGIRDLACDENTKDFLIRNINIIQSVISYITGPYVTLAEHKSFNEIWTEHKDNTYEYIANKFTSIDEKIYRIVFAYAYQYQGEAAAILADFYDPDRKATNQFNSYIEPEQYATLIKTRETYLQLAHSGRIVSAAFRPKIISATNVEKATEELESLFENDPLKRLNSDQCISLGTNLYRQATLTKKSKAKEKFLEDGKKAFVAVLNKDREEGKTELNAPALFGIIFYHTIKNQPHKINLKAPIADLENNFLPKQKSLWEALKSERATSTEPHKNGSSTASASAAAISITPTITSSNEKLTSLESSETITDKPEATLEENSWSAELSANEGGWSIVGNTKTINIKQESEKKNSREQLSHSNQAKTQASNYLKPPITSKSIVAKSTVSQSLVPNSNKSSNKPKPNSAVIDTQKAQTTGYPALLNTSDFPSLKPAESAKTSGVSVITSNLQLAKKDVLPNSATENLTQPNNDNTISTSSLIVPNQQEKNFSDSSAKSDITTSDITTKEKATDDNKNSKDQSGIKTADILLATTLPTRTSLDISYSEHSIEPITQEIRMQNPPSIMYSIPFMGFDNVANTYVVKTYGIHVPQHIERLGGNPCFLRDAAALLQTQTPSQQDHLNDTEKEFFSTRILSATMPFTQTNATNHEWNLLIKLAAPGRNKDAVKFVNDHIFPLLKEMHPKTRSGILDHTASGIYRSMDSKQISK